MAFGGGLLSGLNEGLDARQKKKNIRATQELANEKLKLQKDKFDQSNIQEGRRSAEFEFNAAGKVLENKGFTDATKLDYYNNEYVPLAQAVGIRLPTLTEWDPQMQDYLKRIDLIVNDKNLTKDQKQFGLSKIDIESRGTIKSRAEFDASEKTRITTEKGKALDLIRAVDEAGEMTQAQQKELKSFSPTARNAAFKEFKGGGSQAKKPLTSEGQFIAKHIQELIDSGMTTKKAIERARKDFPKQQSILEQILVERFPGLAGGAGAASNVIDPKTGRRMAPRRDGVEFDDDPLELFKDKLNSPGLE